MTDLTISIINYKTKELTAECLKSILDRDWDITYEVKVIDNNSADGSLEFLKAKFPKVKFIKSNQNLGFAGGHNLVLSDIKSRYVLILNSDAVILEETLDGMVKFMDENPLVGIASCKVLNFDKKLQPNGGDLPFGWALINWLFNLETFGIKSPAFHRNDNSYYENSHEVGWVSGSFMIIKKEVLDKVGMLNDKFFMYFEDVEYCFRVKRAGYQVAINPTYSIEHLSGGSLDNPRFRQWSGEYKGLIKFYQYQFGALPAFLIRMLIYKSTLLRIIVFAIIGKLDFSKTYAKVITSL